jgi:hypothetical protein
MGVSDNDRKKQTWHPSVKLNDGGSSPVRIRDVEKYRGRTFRHIEQVSEYRRCNLEALLHMNVCDMSALKTS